MRPEVHISDFFYDLPDSRIAKYPLENRDDSKLLINIDDNFKEDRFKNVAKWLPDNSIIVFNNTKVVPARLIFKRDTGAIIEIFCLEPHTPSDYQENFACRSTCRWKAIVGNIKRWKGDTLSLYTEHIEGHRVVDFNLRVNLINRIDNAAIVEFTWDGNESFSKVIELCGRMPIPPYLNRSTDEIDYTRYQTVYAKMEGSVAAPTAGLHFTEYELQEIDNKGITRCEVSLHVGAGTFLPIKSESISDHIMHSEPFSITKDFVKFLADNIRERHVISVGTTSTRCLESIYYLGVHVIERGEPGFVEQWEPYRDQSYNISSKESLVALWQYMDSNSMDTLFTRTSIIIVPGFQFRVMSYLITNFHQPKSTLLLLISAIVGDKWRDMYQFALDNNFRFLSYGDSSILSNVLLYSHNKY